VDWIFYGISNTLRIAYTKMVEPMAFTKYPYEGIAFTLNFVGVMYYPFKCQSEYDSTQGIYELLVTRYYKLIGSLRA
jgi:hypothetical protein